MITLDGTTGITSPNDTTGNQSYTGTLTGGTGVVNLGSGQFYKDASGNVAVGGVSVNGYGKLQVRNSFLYVNEDGADTRSIYIRSNLSGVPAIQVATNDPLAFTTNNVERMRIDSSGNVGIGAVSSGYALEVVRTTASAGRSAVVSQNLTADGSAGFHLGNNTYANMGGVVGFGSTHATKANFIQIGTENAFPVTFQTAGTERMRVASSGTVMVGTTDGNYVGNGIRFNPVQDGGNISIGHPGGSTNGMVYMGFGLNGSAIGNIQQLGTTGVAFVTTSDYRLKENIEPMTGALDIVSKLKPVTYSWKVDGSSGQGFIAHELAEVCPDAVAGEKDAIDDEGKPKYQGIDTSFLVATLTAAIKEQQALIESLTTRLTALEAK